MLERITKGDFIQRGILDEIKARIYDDPEKYKHYVTSHINLNEIAREAGIEIEYYTSVSRGEGVAATLNGVFTVTRNLPASQVENISIFSMEENPGTFSRDFIKLFKELRKDPTIRRVEYSTTVGCPTGPYLSYAEKHYNARVVGRKTKAAVLLTGELVDVLIYEILKEG